MWRDDERFAPRQSKADFVFIYAEKLLAFVKGWQRRDITPESHELDDASCLLGNFGIK